MHRLFVAIRPPEHILDLLIDAMDDSPELRWTSEENLHLTLRFIGEVEPPLAEEVAHRLSGIRSPAFELALAGVGMFDRRSGGTLWAGVEPRSPVAALAGKIERACQSVGLEPERRAFHPHITLGRYPSARSAAAHASAERNRGLKSEPFSVDRFLLFESRLSRHGPHYEEVAAYELDGQD